MESGRLSHTRMIEYEDLRNQQLMEVAASQGATISVSQNPNIPYDSQPPITKYFKTRQKPRGLRLRDASSSEGASSGSRQSKDSLKRMAARSPSYSRATGKVAPVTVHTSTKCENASLVALLIPSPIVKPGAALNEVLEIPSTLNKAAIGSPSLHLSTDGPDSVFLVSPVAPKLEPGLDEVDHPRAESPILFTEDVNEAPGAAAASNWRDESLSVFSPIRAEALQRIPPPNGTSGTWYQIGTKMIRETPTPLRTKCTCSQYKNKGWCPCKENECRAYRRAKGIPAWNGVWDSPSNVSTTTVQSPARKFKETAV